MQGTTHTYHQHSTKKHLSECYSGGHNICSFYKHFHLNYRYYNVNVNKLDTLTKNMVNTL